jgi:uncharacterized membrane protein YeaQ/YmgE (transglycosylase-associated protein family)
MASLYDPRPQGGPQQLICRDCSRPVNTWSGMGFCTMCGEPLCQDCSYNKVKVSKKTTTSFMRIYSKTTEIEVEVTICKACKAFVEIKRKQGAMKGIMAGVIGFILVFLPFTILMGVTGLAFSACFGCMMGACLFVIGIYFFLDYSIDRHLGPYCPICGMNLLEPLVQMAHRGQSGSYSIPNSLQCMKCGYVGPRSPYDGLWRFIDKYGPSIFKTTPYEGMADRSYQVRQAYKK